MIAQKKSYNVLFLYSNNDVNPIKDIYEDVQYLELEFCVKFFYEELIQPGKNISHELKIQLQKADLILAFICPRLLASRYIVQTIKQNIPSRRKKSSKKLWPIFLRKVVKPTYLKEIKFVSSNPILNNDGDKNSSAVVNELREALAKEFELSAKRKISTEIPDGAYKNNIVKYGRLTSNEFSSILELRKASRKNNIKTKNTLDYLKPIIDIYGYNKGCMSKMSDGHGIIFDLYEGDNVPFIYALANIDNLSESDIKLFEIFLNKNNRKICVVFFDNYAIFGENYGEYNDHYDEMLKKCSDFENRFDLSVQRGLLTIHPFVSYLDSFYY